MTVMMPSWFGFAMPKILLSYRESAPGSIGVNCTKKAAGPKTDGLYVGEFLRNLQLGVSEKRRYELRSCRGNSGDEWLQVPAADWILQLSHGFGFDLTDAFAGDLEDPTDFFERVG